MRLVPEIVTVVLARRVRAAVDQIRAAFEWIPTAKVGSSPGEVEP